MSDENEAGIDKGLLKAVARNTGSEYRKVKLMQEGMDTKGLESAARSKNERMNRDYRQLVHDKWQRLLDPDNLSKVEGTPAYREANQPVIENRSPLTDEEARSIVGTSAYREANPTQQPDKWADKFAKDIEKHADLVSRAKTVDELNLTGETTKHANFNASFDEVRDALIAINPNKYKRAFNNLNSDAYNTAVEIAENLRDGVNADRSSTLDLVKDVILANRGQNSNV